MNPPEPDRRLLYLQRMGIDVWQARRPGIPQAEHPEAAVAGMDWEALTAAVSACRLCPLGEARTQAVLGAGDRSSRIVVVGRAPAGAEDRQGEPFVGMAGQLLDRMLQAIAWPRNKVYITNLVKCRPPGQRDPRALEMAECAPYLQHQLNLIQPALILAAGEAVARQLLGTEAALDSLRGRVHRYGVQETPLVATHDPGDLLRSPADKSQAWEDLKLMRAALDGG
jgi:DNA polymerase